MVYIKKNYSSQLKQNTEVTQVTDSNELRLYWKGKKFVTKKWGVLQLYL